jgi:hypothetical protein
MTPSELHAHILRLWQNGAIQIGGLGKYNSFIHIDTRPWIGHLAQWDFSTEGGKSAGGKGPATRGEEEGEAEEDEGINSAWIILAAAVAALLYYLSVHHGR